MLYDQIGMVIMWIENIWIAMLSSWVLSCTICNLAYIYCIIAKTNRAIRSIESLAQVQTCLGSKLYELCTLGRVGERVN